MPRLHIHFKLENLHEEIAEICRLQKYVLKTKQVQRI